MSDHPVIPLLPWTPGQGPGVLWIDANGLWQLAPIPQNTGGATLILTDTDGALAFLTGTGVTFSESGFGSSFGNAFGED